MYSCTGCPLYKVAQLKEQTGAEIQPVYPLAKLYVLAQNCICWGKRRLFLICKKAPVGIVVTLTEKAAAAMTRLRRRQKKPRV